MTGTLFKPVFSYFNLITFKFKFKAFNSEQVVLILLREVFAPIKKTAKYPVLRFCMACELEQQGPPGDLCALCSSSLPRVELATRTGKLGTPNKSWVPDGSISV